MKAAKSSGLLLVLTMLMMLSGVIVAFYPAASPGGAQAAYQDKGSASDTKGDQNPTEVSATTATRKGQQATIIDHDSTDLSQVPEYWVQQAKAQHRVSYGHTSHGSQPISGMGALMDDPSNGGLYDFDTNGAIQVGVLSIADGTPTGDLGNPDRTTWASRTRDYLYGSGSDRNVVVWSWCGQADTTEANIETYLNLMNELEGEFPDVTFVYMTGHLNGTGIDGDLNQRNDQIRDYCATNDKVLFDFADIESYDPDGNYYPDADDSCPWCETWCNDHPEDCTNLPDSCAHSHPFNCLRKGKAFWWMMARLAGWEGQASKPDLTPSYKDVSPPFADYGDRISYTVVIRSGDPLTSSVLFTDTIQDGLSYVPGTLAATAGNANDAGVPTLRWSGVLTPTPAITITYAATVTQFASGTAGLVLPQTIANTATIDALGHQTITRTATVRIGWIGYYLPLVVTNDS